IDKPAGLLVHPVKNENNTLLDFLKNKYPNAQLVHRLDKDTSGLMIVAKNQKTYEWLKSQFQNRQIKKKYIALVHGILKDKKGIIAKSISKSRKRGGRQTIAPIGKRREAITRYTVIKEFSNYTLLEAMPETGRTHQIRVHLASIGHPIAGDERYKFKRQQKLERLNRQFLHASYLQFKMSDGNIKEFYSNLPEELNKVLEKLCPLN
ncbi:MAG: RluA family pseudouridine synthase, partial [Candidatus Portnoybacteria bacterium CG10_big_fil_rev_8_21_14_0_10_38_18]